jgi:hypothetical protein
MKKLLLVTVVLSLNSITWAESAQNDVAQAKFNFCATHGACIYEHPNSPGNPFIFDLGSQNQCFGNISLELVTTSYTLDAPVDITFEGWSGLMGPGCAAFNYPVLTRPEFDLNGNCRLDGFGNPIFDDVETHYTFEFLDSDLNPQENLCGVHPPINNVAADELVNRTVTVNSHDGATFIEMGVSADFEGADDAGDYYATLVVTATINPNEIIWN